MKPTNQAIPSKCTVLIIGGGPAGSSAATLLTQSGIDAVVLEKANFPRNQVGESLIPHFWQFADLLGVTDKIQQEGFVVKSGGLVAWNDKVHHIKFSEYGYTRPGLHVERDIFDNLLLDHAESCGAVVFNQVAVKQVDFADANQPKVHYLDKRGDANVEGVIACHYVIDASGHSSFLAGQFGSRQIIDSSLNFLSLWGYYKNALYVGADRQSHTIAHLKTIAPVTFVMSYADCWIWHIVLREKTSVGLVVHTDQTKGMDKAQREAFFKHTCANVPHLKHLLAEAEFIEGSLEFRPDYSYYSTRICSENYYCIGDAA
ncbi:MAG: NAD(P)-binding protein, partial [Methylococcaceae bacterium]|nr:NAD(P)-binding protein [Methylococcaceae bacterium]